MSFQIFDITDNDAGQRLDRFILKILPRATRGLVFKLNRKGKIKVGNGGKFSKQDNEYKIQVGEQIKVFLTPDDFSQLQAETAQVPQVKKDQKLKKEDIVYEDGEILVVNKNPGLNVHPADHKTKEISLIEQVQDYLGDRYSSLTFKPSLVHRIDRDTSGIVLIAKEKSLLVKLMKDFRDHTNIKKTYYALVFGKLEQKSGIINLKLERIENAKNENKVQVSKKGDEAISHYKVLSERHLQTKQGSIDISEVLVEIHTGRMHQIRVHMSSIGHPILGDDTYGNKSLNHYLCRDFGLCRQALHAFRIEFMQYKQAKKIKLEARLKDDMKKFLQYLK